MWLATKYGFYSVVCAHGVHGEPSTTLMMIRARKHAHLAALKRFHPELGKIKKSVGTDYPYRIIARRDVVLLVVARLAADIEYKNFKNAAHDEAPGDGAYGRFLYEVWSRGLQLTPLRVRRR